jgi:hypothetical protein
MRTRFSIAVGTVALAVAGSVLAAAPANAQNVTFTLAGGALSVSEPSADAALTPAAGLAGLTGTTASGSLGSTVVTDNRAGIAGWTSKITGTTAFTNGNTTIPVTAAKAFVPGVVSTTGTVLATAGTYLSAATGLALTSSAQTLVTATAVVGNNTATFNPSLSITIPGDATAGAYTGVVTQTVS